MLFLALLLVPSILAACPPGSFFDDSFGKCYKYVSTPATFLAAESACAGSGGNLITIGDGFENSFVIGMARGSGNVWIGLSYLVDNQFSWISGKNSTYRDWAPGYPTSPSTQQCTNIRDTDNKWVNEKCSAIHPYVCEIDPNAVPVNCPTMVPTGPPPCTNVVCDAGYQLLTSTCKCYKFDSYLRSYAAGKQMCINDGATLVTIENADVNNFLLSIAGSTRTGPWIGIDCETITVSQCTWPDGTTAAGYNNFESGFPRAGDTGAYMADYLSSTDSNYGKWLSYGIQGTGTGGTFCQKTPRSVTAILNSRKEERPSRLYKDLKKEL